MTNSVQKKSKRAAAQQAIQKMAAAAQTAKQLAKETTDEETQKTVLKLQQDLEAASNFTHVTEEIEDDEKSRDSATDLLPCGTDNKDGTFFGGGPFDIHCSQCAKARFPEEYGHGHQGNQITFS